MIKIGLFSRNHIQLFLDEKESRIRWTVRIGTVNGKIKM